MSKWDHFIGALGTVVLFCTLFIGGAIIHADYEYNRGVIDSVPWHSAKIGSGDVKGPDPKPVSYPMPYTETTAFYAPDEIEVKDSIKASLFEYVWKYSRKTSRAQTYRIIEAALKTGQPELVLAVIRHESNFNPTAVSTAGAIGLGQIMPRYHKESLIKKGFIKEERDLYEIEPNIRCTASILQDCWWKAHGNLTTALKYYYGASNPTYRKRIGETFFELKWLVDSSTGRRSI